MIGRLIGVVASIKPPTLLLDVGGVGYELDLPIPDCAALGNIGQKTTLYTHLVVREDAHSLYGFLHVDGRDTFRTLIKVSGIGPRIALALLSTLMPQELSYALENSDVARLSQTPGIGKKMAERMILELKGKLLIDFGGNETSLAMASHNVLHTDIANALLSLGYTDKDVKIVLKNVPNDIADLSQGIKIALKILSK